MTTFSCTSRNLSYMAKLAPCSRPRSRHRSSTRSALKSLKLDLSIPVTLHGTSSSSESQKMFSGVGPNQKFLIFQFFFVRAVREKFHFCLIITRTGETLQNYCRSYPTLINNINFLWFQHNSKAALVQNALFHLEALNWMTAVQRENIAHLLASMHLCIRQQDDTGSQGGGEFGHLNDTTYQKFVEK